MSTKKLFLHIGTQKTGTTTIQSILSRNKKKLLSEGISYLGRFAETAREIRVIESSDTELVEKLREEIEAEISFTKNWNIHTYVISNEKFSGDKLISYRNAGLIAKLLKDTLKPFSFEIKIIVYLRRQDDYIESTYAQRIYSGATLSFEEFMEQFDKKDFHWDDFLHYYAEVFGKENLIVKRFDKKYLPKKESLIQSFGESIGSEFLQHYSQEIIKNPGFSRDALEISRITNQYLDKKKMRRFRDILKKYGDSNKQCIFFNNQKRRQFLENYKESNRYVATHFLNDPSGVLFSEPEYPEDDTAHVYDGLTVEYVTLFLTRVILRLNEELEKEREKVRKMKAPGAGIKTLKTIYRKIWFN